MLAHCLKYLSKTTLNHFIFSKKDNLIRFKLIPSDWFLKAHSFSRIKTIQKYLHFMHTFFQNHIILLNKLLIIIIIIINFLIKFKNFIKLNSVFKSMINFKLLIIKFLFINFMDSLWQIIIHIPLVFLPSLKAFQSNPLDILFPSLIHLLLYLQNLKSQFIFILVRNLLFQVL